ncbi:uncharacterized protein VP01_2743g1 [Puccinia sorghi]|uniref:DUF8040 domain-containing protein n=1 Tax=Puccinia sorghi TaxID=27349 RepID=A0A0L6V330_9BASI|nr:uncharacterized protein VP01_2743g1 [Puccinia sorghi]
MLIERAELEKKKTNQRRNESPFSFSHQSPSKRIPYNNLELTGASYTNTILQGTLQKCVNALVEVEPVSNLLSIEEQLAIFLYITGHKNSNWQAQGRFQHSGQKISKCLKNTSPALVLIVFMDTYPPIQNYTPSLKNSWGLYTESISLQKCLLTKLLPIITGKFLLGNFMWQMLNMFLIGVYFYLIMLKDIICGRMLLLANGVKLI